MWNVCSHNGICEQFTPACKRVNVLLSAHAGSIKEAEMPDYFGIYYKWSRHMGYDHWDSLLKALESYVRNDGVG